MTQIFFSSPENEIYVGPYRYFNKLDLLSQSYIPFNCLEITMKILVLCANKFSRNFEFSKWN